MSGSAPTAITKSPEDLEMQQSIIDELKKLTPLSIKLKGFALNHHTAKLVDIGLEEEAEIEKINTESQRNFQQHLQSINDLITGARAPTDAELKEWEQYFTEEEKGKKAELLNNFKPLENYWATVFQNDQILKPYINENDEGALKHVSRVEYKLSEDAAHPHNFSVTIHFSANEYFDNEVLSVQFHLQAPRDVTKTEGTKINWKAGKDTTKKQVTKKQKNKKTGQTRTVTKEETVPSFFNLFGSIVAPPEDKELDEDEEKLQQDILDQVDIGYALIEEVIPFSLEYFLGVRKDFEGEGDDEDFEDDEGDDDDEDDEPVPKSKGKGGKGAKPAAGGAGGEGKQECKQQ
jgi:nucleosome assembly protein 1-like 1